MTKRPIPPFPRPRDIAGDVADLDDKLVQFGKRTRELEVERMTIARHLADGKDTQPAPPHGARVAALMGESAPEPGKPDKARLAEIVVELADLRTATELTHERRRVALSKASAAIREQIRPEYRARVRAVAEALGAAREASADLRALTDALGTAEVEWTGLGVAFPSFMGAPNDPESALARYFRELVETGHIAASEIPEGLRHK